MSEVYMPKKSGGEHIEQAVRRFVVHEVPLEIDLDACERETYARGTLASGNNGSVTLNRLNDKYWLNHHGSDLLPPDEDQVDLFLTREQFALGWKCTVGWRTEKTRFHIPFEDKTILLDIYRDDDNRGSMLAEVQFNDSLQAMDFDPPAWLSEEVSGDSRYESPNIEELGVPRPY